MLRKTEAYKILIRGKMLSEAVAWFDAFQDRKLQSIIIDMIQKDQLQKDGTDANNEVIGYYSRLTSMINPKKRFNEPYDLEDTGEFYRSMMVVVLADAFIIRADSEKMEDQEWWRDEIVMLNEQNMLIFKEHLKEKYIEYARKVLFNRR